MPKNIVILTWPQFSALLDLSDKLNNGQISPGEHAARSLDLAPGLKLGQDNELVVK